MKLTSVACVFVNWTVMVTVWPGVTDDELTVTEISGLVSANAGAEKPSKPARTATTRTNNLRLRRVFVGMEEKI
jgi:hypothetical protein